MLGIAREAFRRGIEQSVYTTYHCGQNIVWAYWMRTAFSLSSDPAVLRQALEAGSRSVARFVDYMVAALSRELRRERAELARSSHARRFEVVSLILESAPITAGRASTRLDYDLRRRIPPPSCGPTPAARTRPRSPRPPRPSAPRPRPAGADRDRQLLIGVGLARRCRRYRRWGRGGAMGGPIRLGRTRRTPGPGAPGGVVGIGHGRLIPRNALFGNPERISPHISPDGTRLAWIVPRDGVLNVWVAPIGAYGVD